jgi:hypothetical protein
MKRVWSGSGGFDRGRTLRKKSGLRAIDHVETVLKTGDDRARSWTFWYRSSERGQYHGLKTNDIDRKPVIEINHKIER